jgi:hypothetical protein
LLGKAKEIEIESFIGINAHEVAGAVSQWLKASGEVEVLGVTMYSREAFIIYRQPKMPVVVDTRIDLDEDILPISVSDMLSRYTTVINALRARKVEFIEKPNGHFMIYGSNGVLRYQYWATTEKIISQITQGKAVGLNTLLTTIDATQQLGNW